MSDFSTENTVYFTFFFHFLENVYDTHLSSLILMCIVILEFSSQQTSSENVAQASSKGRPLSNVSIGLGEYQRTLEEVLTWLLGAEDRLAVMPPIANTTEEVKDQFHDLEVGSCLSRMFYTSICLNLHVFPYRRQF